MKIRTTLDPLLSGLALVLAGIALFHLVFADTFIDPIVVDRWRGTGIPALLAGLLGTAWLWRRRRQGEASDPPPPPETPDLARGKAPDAGLRRQSWIPLAIFLGVAVLIGAFGWAFYRHAWREQRATQEHQLAAIAEFKRQQIEAWLGERRQAAMAWRKGSIFGETVVRWLAGNATDHGLERQIEKRLWTIKEFFGYAGVALLDKQGRVRLRVGDDRARSPHLLELSRMALASGEIQFSDLYRAAGEGYTDINMDFIAPLSGLDSERPAAVLAFTVASSAFLFPLIQSWPLPSASAEIQLVRAEAGSVLFLNDLRHQRDTAFNLSFPLASQTLLAVRAVAGAQGIVTGNDYRGVPVLAFITGIDGTPWRLIAKIDAAEVDAPARRDAAIVTGACLALMSAAAVATGLGWRKRRYALEAAYLRERAGRDLLSTRLDDLTRDANDIVLLTDTAGQILDANDRAIAAYGHSREALCGLSFGDLVPPGLRAAAGTELARAGRDGHARFETLHRSRQGAEFPVEVGTHRVGPGDAPLLQSIIRDIGERRRAEAEIRRLSALNAVLGRCNPAVLPQVQRGGFLEAICRLVVRQGGFVAACVYGGQTPDLAPDLLAHFGNHAGAVPVPAADSGAIREVPGELGWVRHAGLIWLPDARDQIFRLPWLGETPLTGFGCYAALPLSGVSGFTGTLMLFGAEPEAFAGHVEFFLRTLAEDASLGLEFLAQREELQASRDRLGAILDTVDAVIWSLDPYTFDLTYANPSTARVTGYAAEVLLAHPGLWWNMLLPEDRDRLAVDLDQAKLTGVLAGDYRILRLDGHPRWLNLQGRMVYDPNRRPLRLDGVGLDVTGRHLNEFANEAIQFISSLFLQRCDQPGLYRCVAEFLAAGLRFPMAFIDLYDPVTERLEVLGRTGGPPPTATESITGAVAVGGMPWCEPDLAGCADPRCEPLRRAGGQSFIAVPLWADQGALGGLLLADTAPHPDVESLVVYLSLIANHLALEMDRRRKARILDRHAQELRQLLDSLFIYVGILTPEGMVTDVNRTALDDAGLRLEDILGRPFDETPWWNGSDTAQQRLREAVAQAAQGEAVRYDTQIRCRPGQSATIDFGITPIRDEAGQITHLVFSGVDIGEHCRAEEALRRGSAWLRVGFDLAPVGLAMVEPHSNQLQKVNVAFCQLLGFTEATALGRPWPEFIHPEDRAAHCLGIQRLLDGEIEVYAAHERYLHRDGTSIPRQSELRYGRYADGNLGALMATIAPPAMDSPP